MVFPTPPFPETAIIIVTYSPIGSMQGKGKKDFGSLGEKFKTKQFKIRLCQSPQSY
jgi:hypothetical protein